MSRIRIAALLLLAWASLAQGARDVEFNVDFFCGWDGYYRPMEWTPVEVGIAADLKEPFSGTFTMTARQDGLNTLNIIHPFVLTPDRPLSTPLVTKFAFATDRCSLNIRDEKGHSWWQRTINLWDFSAQNRLLRVVQEQDMLIGLIGQAQFGLLRLPQAAVSMSGRGPGKVYLGAKVPRVVPWDWTGYVSLDALVICDVDWSQLRPQQIEALREWISNGGAALLILGQHPLPADTPLARFLPFRIEGPRQVEIPQQNLADWGLNPDRTQTVTAWSLSPKPGVAIEEKAELPDGSCLYGRGHAGFGRVAVLGFNPSQLSEDQAGRSAAFWTRQIAACCRMDTPSASNPQSASGRSILLADEADENTPAGFNPNNNMYRISTAQSASNHVMEFLYQLEQMKPLSIWWIVLTLMALAVLLGPVDYFVLKKLDKLPYTWLTSAGWIVIFTVGAYFGVQWLRSGAMEVRAVTVLDGIADSNCTWATSYTSLFAPRSGDYRLAGLAPNQWWSGIAPMQEEQWMYQRDAGMQQIHCLQVDGGNLPVSLPINMWTVQPLVSEWTLDRMPFAATVTYRAAVDDRGATGKAVTIEIRNPSDSAIQKGYVLFEDTYADLGRVPAHTTRQFDTQTRPFRPWQAGPSRPVARGRGRPPVMMPTTDIPRYPSLLSGRADAESAFLAQGCLDRALAMHTYLRSGAALVCVAFENAPLPIEVKDRTYAVNHIQFARELVFPKSAEDRR